ncbi:transcriptional regulator [Clostridium botulinum]|uniref:GyrI-like domain-containing protein n=1 Tax=Clostridium botulinum TaxID=1491 RepID=UPI000174E7E0|nr:GyrI-like domain-containing protein [Clostridium botulinum]ACD53814.1 transcriptional regulator, AraC family [Clostridium botulinum E3 str. Alaska E43]AJF30930.1 transcriptional regulator [Clostridium botulinum]AJF33992.1 transcriptional regulator [Clostridium botulinum]MBY6787838.1 effector binding domain-containing protein [Clostridium botulinum]MBY6815479.1 effector binding domain-containing protein [Clostridium botulinum]
MNYEVVNLKEKKVVGVTARTKNYDENMIKIIGSLWQNLYEGGVYNTIKNKANDKAIGIYSDYESDVNSEYSVTVGCEVNEIEDISEDTIVKVIPAGKYAKFIVRGQVQQAVNDFWQELWNMKLNRNYKCDFEEYQNCDMENAEIHIYISID